MFFGKKNDPGTLAGKKRPFVNVNDQVLKKGSSFRFPYSRDGAPVSRLFDV